jgi:transcriptional regulator with XRE-family HTH domain
MARNREKGFARAVVSRIKKLREQKGITLQEFYNDTGIHLARIESEERDLRIGTVKQICDYFGVSVTEFFKGIEK